MLQRMRHQLASIPSGRCSGRFSPAVGGDGASVCSSPARPTEAAGTPVRQRIDRAGPRALAHPASRVPAGRTAFECRTGACGKSAWWYRSVRANRADLQASAWLRTTGCMASGHWYGGGIIMLEVQASPSSSTLADAADLLAALRHGGGHRGAEPSSQRNFAGPVQPPRGTGRLDTRKSIGGLA